MSRKELIEAYLAANHAGADVRGEVSKTITAYNRANKNDVITTADVIHQSINFCLKMAHWKIKKY